MYVDTQQRPQGEQVDAVAPSRMKLSEAMRIGAKLRPQGFGAPVNRWGDGTSCAMQAAGEGMTRILARTTHQAAELAGIAPSILCEKIWIMNDVKRLSREQIADWLAAQGL